MLRFPLAPGLALVALLVSSAPPVAAAHAPEGPAWVGLRPVTWSFARVGAAAPTAAAMRVERDPDTGLLVPAGAAASARLAAPAALRPDAAPLQVQVLRDGSLMIDLGDRYLMDFSVVRGPDGRLRAACTQDGAHAPADHAHAAWPEE